MNFLDDMVMLICANRCGRCDCGCSWHYLGMSRKYSSAPFKYSRVSVTNEASSTKKKKDSSSSESSSSSSKAESQKISQVGSSTTEYTLKNAPKSGSKLTFKAGTSNAWISVSSDGTQSWSSTLQTGTSHTEKIAKGVSKVTITMGNAPQTTITVNGKSFDLTPKDTLKRQSLNY